MLLIEWYHYLKSKCGQRLGMDISDVISYRECTSFIPQKALATGHCPSAIIGNGIRSQMTVFS